MPKLTLKRKTTQGSPPAAKAKAITPATEKKTAVLDTAVQKTAVDFNNIHPSQISQLQRTAGNQAIRRAVQRSAAQGMVIQRKMTVGPVGDKYEQEADTVAKQVVGNLNNPQPQAAQRQENDDELQMKPHLQRQADGDELQMKAASTMNGGDVSSDLETDIQSAKGSGQSLDNNTQASMGQAFNADFSGVNIHTNEQADTLNRSLQARAFTTGNDIFFRSGEYSPNNSGGQELLAHELTHVVQQTGTVQRKTANLTALRYSAGFKFGKKGSSYKQIKKAVARYNGLGGDDFSSQANHLNHLSSINALITKWMASYNGRKKKKKNDANKKLELDTLRDSVDAEVAAVQGQIHDELVLVQANTYSGSESLRKLQEASAAISGLLPDVQGGLAGWLGAIPGLITTAEGRMEDVAGKFTDDNVTEHEDEAVGGGLNKLDYIKYDFGLHQAGDSTDKAVTGGSFEGYFQADVDEDPDFDHHRGRYTNLPKDNPEFSKRSRAVYELSKLLDPSLIPPTFAAQHKGKMGSIMQKVDGQTGHEIREGGRSGDIMGLVQMQETFNNPTFRRSLSNLYLFDVISGQVDRHGGNYLVVKENGVIKGVKGIDNDLAFGDGYDFDKFNAENAGRKENDQFSYVAGNMPSELNEIDREFSLKIIALAQNNQDAVRGVLTGLIKDSEIQATLARLVKLANFLQQLINTNNGAIKAVWN